MADKVAIIGGGVGGLSTAHHLSAAGLQGIAVYEATDEYGGKACSQYVDAAHAKHFPGEHGFRFFPHFYQHLLDTMRSIPASGGNVQDHLVPPGAAGIA